MLVAQIISLKNNFLLIVISCVIINPVIFKLILKNMALKPHRVGRRKASKSHKTAKRLETKRVMLEDKAKKKVGKK